MSPGDGGVVCKVQRCKENECQDQDLVNAPKHYAIIFTLSFSPSLLILKYSDSIQKACYLDNSQIQNYVPVLRCLPLNTTEKSYFFDFCELIILHHPHPFHPLPAPSCLAVFSETEAPALQHSCWESILTCHGGFPRTSSHRSDWSGWWYRPRGSPALPRSLAQSRTAPYSSAELQRQKQKVERRRREKRANGIILWEELNLTISIQQD